MRRAIIGIAIVGAVVLLAVVLSSSDVRRSGSNGVAPTAAVALAPGERACQLAEIPPDTASVAVWSAPGAPPGRTRRVAVTIGAERRSAAAGALSDVAPDGRPLAQLAPEPGAGPLRLCMRNRSDGRVRLLGAPGGAVAVDFFSARQSWWQAAPTIADRFGLGKSGLIGGWALWLALALVIAAWAIGWRAFAAAGARP